jgi:hypothetical protein
VRVLSNGPYFILIIVLLLPVIEFSSYSQDDYDKSKENFEYGEYYLSTLEYREALPFYRLIYRNDSLNANINYRIGQCYMNIRGEKIMSIPYLERAIKNISAQYTAGDFDSDAASIEALFLLGEAYQKNNQLDEALEAYQEYMNWLQANDIENFRKAELRIQSIATAKQEQDNPVDIKLINLGSNINSRFSDYNPVVNGDQNILIYTSFWESADLIFQSDYLNGEWTKPVDITEEVGSEGDCYTGEISNDGKELYLIRQGNYNSDIYVSYMQDNKWSAMKKLNKKINSNNQETSLSLSANGKIMYFSSNRSGGEGGFDIYKSEKKKGEWCKPVNLGNIINTSLNEEAPCILSDNKTLLFSSEGHRNMGGMDIFCSELQGDSIWLEPVNIGSPINTTDDDLFFMCNGKGTVSYFSKYDPLGYGKHDIFKLETCIEKIIKEDIVEDKKVPVLLTETLATDEVITYSEEPFTDESYGDELYTEETFIDESYVEESYTDESYTDTSDSTTNIYTDEQSADRIPYYTIQVMALRKLVSTSYFKNLDNVKIHKGADLINRYTWGKYHGFSLARKYLDKVRELGYDDAFIREINSISNYEENNSSEKR